MMAGYDLPLRAIRQHISSALDLLVHIDRLEDGSRRVVQVTEVLRMESDVVTLQELFVARPPDEESAAEGRGGPLITPLTCSGLKPHFLEKLAANGVMIAPDFFEKEEGAPAGVRPSFAAAAFGGTR
ncbi:MAG: hypothetical protein ACXVYM_02270, partial [Gaiellaceae bacterium]